MKENLRVFVFRLSFRILCSIFTITIANLTFIDVLYAQGRGESPNKTTVQPANPMDGLYFFEAKDGKPIDLRSKKDGVYTFAGKDGNYLMVELNGKIVVNLIYKTKEGKEIKPKFADGPPYIKKSVLDDLGTSIFDNETEKANEMSPNQERVLDEKDDIQNGKLCMTCTKVIFPDGESSNMYSEVACLDVKSLNEALNDQEQGKNQRNRDISWPRKRREIPRKREKLN
ncbi:hypothetical protein EF405_03915 [Cyclobacteriaceae bacterium YHN15]|nr:hypothetical protein EF405_03915 [Cyclobacteriaceae bacterium YHN15]